MIDTYKDNAIEIFSEYPFRVSYEEKRAVDTGGVFRDMLSAFWDCVYVKHFDGETLLVPSTHTNKGLIDITYESRILQLRPEDQLTLRTISKAFRLLPETVLLISECDTVAIPHDGVFNNVDNLYTWSVEGNNITINSTSSRNTDTGSCTIPNLL